MKFFKMQFLICFLLSFLALETAFVLPAHAMEYPESLSGLVALKGMQQQSKDYEIAMQNNRPSLIEFYADWCASCQHFAPKLKAIRDRFPTEINWVAIDIDDVRWNSLIREYRVVGVPHLALLNRDRAVRESWTGEVPEAVLESAIAEVLN